MSVTVLAANRVALRGLCLTVYKGLNHVCHSSLQSKRSPCLRLHQGVYERKVWITSAIGSPQIAQARAAEDMSNTYQHELQAACAAVRLAARLCTKVQLQLKAGEKQDKSDDSPVTIADYGSQALVAYSLQSSLPSMQFSMVAEEDSADLRSQDSQAMADRITDEVNSILRQEDGAPQLSKQAVLDLIDQGASQGGPQGRHWVLDPIDGTRGFVGLRQYAICLGLLDQGQVVLGVLGCPNLPQQPIQEEDGAAGVAERVGTEGIGCLFTAIKGQGAFVGPLNGRPPSSRLQLQDRSDFSQARFMESYESKHSDQSFTSKLAKELGVTAPPLRLDSQAKYGALARGDAAILLRFPHKGYREKIWDHAAGVVIVQEAGAVITDASGAPLELGQSRWLDIDRGIVTATPKVHAAILKAISKNSQD
ncbi:TPA: hypothetical protein ACH3X1_009602 [Trebouxia sp. C0004]